MAPVAEELDRTKAFPYEIVQKMADLDLMGIPFPEQLRRRRRDILSYALAVEELARIDSSVAITMAAHLARHHPDLQLGKRRAEEEWMPVLTSAKKLAAFGLTEPEAGSDAGNTKTRAVLDGDEWVINGAKQFATNSGTDISGCVSITAVTGEDERGRAEISNFIVPNGTPGYTVREAVPQDGLERFRHTRSASTTCAFRVGDARPGGSRLQAVPSDPRRRPHRRRAMAVPGRPGRPR